MEIALIVFAVVLMLVGLIGIIIPILPSLPYIWLVALGYAWFTGFANITLAQIAWLTIFPVVGFFVDYLSGMVGIRLSGGSLKTLGWGALGMLIGTILLPPFGGFFGLGISVFAAELIGRRKLFQATNTSLSAILGQAAGMVINLIIGIIMIGLFILWIF